MIFPQQVTRTYRTIKMLDHTYIAAVAQAHSASQAMSAAQECAFSAKCILCLVHQQCLLMPGLPVS